MRVGTLAESWRKAFGLGYEGQQYKKRRINFDLTLTALIFAKRLKCFKCFWYRAFEQRTVRLAKLLQVLAFEVAEGGGGGGSDPTIPEEVVVSG